MLSPTQAKLGLHRVPTYTGDFRWLCRHHYDAWQPQIPDVIHPENSQTEQINEKLTQIQKT